MLEILSDGPRAGKPKELTGAQEQQITALHRTQVLSLDEKTNLQALERIAQAPLKVGQVQRRDPEYKRHGTPSLIAAYEGCNGRIVAHRLHPTRTEEDFVLFIKPLLTSHPPEDSVILLSDQLNTHRCASLVELVAQHLGFKEDLGKKEGRGILQNRKSRPAFLEDPHHRIRLVYTPAHGSGLNPIENWFSKLQRHVLPRGHFLSVKEREEKMEAYLLDYNRCMAKPMKWSFKGFGQEQKKENIVPVN